MRLNVNPTRMELLKLRRRIAIARRGHKLLKDKQDELMRTFMELIDRLRLAREEAEKSLRAAVQNYLLAQAQLGREIMDEQFNGLDMEVLLHKHTEGLMSLQLPRYELSVKRKDIPYGQLNTRLIIDQTLKQYQEVLKLLVDLAQQEKIIKLLAEEIGKTRRRVNALEYILIPNLVETMRYINMKLSENERSTVTRLMRIKDLVHKEKSA